MKSALCFFHCMRSTWAVNCCIFHSLNLPFIILIRNNRWKIFLQFLPIFRAACIFTLLFRTLLIQYYVIQLCIVTNCITLIYFRWMRLWHTKRNMMKCNRWFFPGFSFFTFFCRIYFFLSNCCLQWALPFWLKLRNLRAIVFTLLFANEL